MPGADGVVDDDPAMAFPSDPTSKGEHVYVDVGTHVSLRPTDDWTVEAWFNVPATTDPVWATIFASRPRGLDLQIQNDAIAASFRDTQNKGQAVRVVTDVRDGLWHHIAAVREHTELRLYLDGELVATEAVSSRDVSYGSGSYQTNLGRDPHFWYGDSPGTLDEMALYDRALTASEISAHHAAVPHPDCVDPVDPVEPNELTVVYPQDGTDVFSAMPVVIDYQADADASEVEFRLDGDLVASLPVPARTALLDVSSAAVGPATLTVDVLSVTGEVLFTASVDVTLDHITGGNVTDELLLMHHASELGADDFLLASQAAILDEAARATQSDAVTDRLMALIPEAWAETSADARVAFYAMSAVSPGAGQPDPTEAIVVSEVALSVPDAVGSGSAPCAATSHLWAGEGVTPDSTFCEYLLVHPGTLPDGTPHVPIRWYYESTIDRPSHAELATVPQVLVAASNQVWRTQATFPSFEPLVEQLSAVQYPEPLTIFVRDGTGSAFSSPFLRMVPIDFGPLSDPFRTHPVRVGADGLGWGLVNELLGTYGWSSMNWTVELAGLPSAPSEP